LTEVNRPEVATTPIFAPEKINEPRKSAAEAVWSVHWQDHLPTAPAEWDAAVRQSPDAWLFHLSDIGPLFLPPGAGPLTFVECRCDGKLLGGAILVVSRYRWHRLWRRQHAKSYIGPIHVSPFVVPLFNEKLVEEAWQHVIEGCAAAAEAMRCDELLLTDTPQSAWCLDSRPVVNRYIRTPLWQHEVSYQYVLDLRPDIEVLFKNLETRCRTSIRRAREQVQVIGGEELVNGREIHTELMVSVYRREGMELVGRENLLRIWDNVYGRGQGKSFFCLLEGKPCSFTAVTRFGRAASYQHAARTDDAPGGAAALGLWSAIEWAKNDGAAWFDCNGAVIETSGRERQRAISMFKRSFGGEIMQVHAGSRNFRPLARATYDFVDAWGVQAKRMLRKIYSYRK
jgi:hypothetical protein